MNKTQAEAAFNRAVAAQEKAHKLVMASFEASRKASAEYERTQDWDAWVRAQTSHQAIMAAYQETVAEKTKAFDEMGRAQP